MTTTRDSQSFARTLRHYREAAGLSQEALAERAGLSARGVSDLERGLSRAPRLHTLSRLAEALALSPNDREVLLRASGRLRDPPPGATVDAFPPASPTSIADADRSTVPAEPPASATSAPTPPLELARPASAATILPGYLTGLVGRADDADALTSLLRQDDIRLVTLLGPGGVGKTRLAVHVGAAMPDDFPDGVAFAPLAPLRDPDLVLATIAQSVGVGETGDASLGESLILALHGRRMLIVLDNCEHLLEAAPSVARVLVRCPGVRVLATSRTPLRLQGEHVFQVRPLLVPSDDIAADTARTWSGIALFLERARATWPDFALTDDNLAAVVGICRHLDGLPLALELAAARVAILPPAALLERLRQRLPILTQGARDAPARHRTLQSTIAWSYDLLQPAEQKLFRALSMFRGGWSLDLAEAVCDSESLLDELAVLVEHSLVQPVEGADGEPRYIMLVTIGGFAAEQLHLAGEYADAARRHAEGLLRLVEEAEPHLVSAERQPWMQRLDLELDNIRAVLGWSLTPEGSVETGMRMAGSLAWYLYLRGHLVEGRSWADRLLAHAGPEPTPGRARGLYINGGISLQQGDVANARAVLIESVEIFRASGDQRRLGQALAMFGLALTAASEPNAALAVDAEALALARETGAEWVEAYTLTNMGAARRVLGETSEADALYRASLALFVRIDDDWGRGIALRALGGLAADQEEFTVAQALYEESAPFFRRTGDTRGLAQALLSLGRVTLRTGQVEYAREVFGEAMSRWREVGVSTGIVRCLAGLADAAAERGDSERAVRLYAASLIQASVTGIKFAPTDEAERERNLVDLRLELDETTYAAAWTTGQAMSLDQAVEEAVESRVMYPPLVTRVLGLKGSY